MAKAEKKQKVSGRVDSGVMPKSGKKIMDHFHEEKEESTGRREDVQSAAWRTIFQYCIEAGMDLRYDLDSGMTPLEQVCSFIGERKA